MANIPTQAELKEHFDYKDGFLYWKKRTGPKCTIIIGTKAGSLNKKNRYRICFKGKNYSSARLIFCWHHGYFPIETDHINRNSFDDRIENLREANRTENCRNRNSFKGSTSQYKGVHFTIKKDKRVSKITGVEHISYTARWVTQIQLEGKRKELGRFKTEKEAAICFNEAAKKHYGEFANLNIIED